MSVTFGFYDSLNGDRKYFTREISQLFNALIKDGIFMHIGTHFEVMEGEGMSVNVGVGLAWFNSTWTLNDAPLPISPEESDLLLTRIDALVLEVDERVSSRINAIKFIKGTPSAQPKKPVLTNTADVHQYALAYITINPGVTAITQSDIENNIGMEECPFVTGILETVDISSLISQWESQWNDMLSSKETDFSSWFDDRKTEFDDWFENVKDQLGTDPAGNLQNQIDEITPNIPYLYKATLLLDDWTGGGPYTQTVSVTPVSGGPDISPSSEMLGPITFWDGFTGSTYDLMEEAGSIVNSSQKVFGSGTISCTTKGEDKPACDIEIFFQAKAGGVL